MVLFLLIPALAGLAVVSAREYRGRRRRTYRCNWGSARQSPFTGGPSRGFGGTLQVSLGNFVGPLISVSKRGGRKVRVPEAYFLTATCQSTPLQTSGILRQLSIIRSTATNSLDLSWGPDAELSFPVRRTGPREPITGDIVLELYGCRRGRFTGKPKKVVLLGRARIALSQGLDVRYRTITAEFRAVDPPGEIYTSRKRVVNAPRGAGLGEMQVSVRLLSPAAAALDSGERARYEYRIASEVVGVRAEKETAPGDEFGPAAVYGPDGSAWVGERTQANGGR